MYELKKVDSPILYQPLKYKEYEAKKDVEYYLLKIKPTRFALSATAGNNSTLNLEGDGDSKLTGKLQSEIFYGQNFSFYVGIEYLNGGFAELSTTNDFDGFPMLVPPDNGGFLNEIYGDFRYLQIPFGLKYTLMPKSRIRPYIGIGLVLDKPIKSALEYEYLGVMTEYNIEEKNVQKKSFCIK